jgi:hypothetical protein
MWVYIIVVLTDLSSPSVKIAAGGAGGRAPNLRGPKLLGKEVDDAVLGPESPGDAEERGRHGQDEVSLVR